jgi:nitrogen regulatory protein P-II 1
MKCGSGHTGYEPQRNKESALAHEAVRLQAGHPVLSCEEQRRQMKKIAAIIQPYKFDAVKEALIAIGIDGMTASEARGYGRQKGQKEVFRGREYTVDLLPKILLEIVVPDARADEVVRAISSSARTGRIGDGKIFVYEIEDAIRIRNEERGDAAL